ncbi:MAG: L-dopachrome tautomerase-related protein [Waterburya sp.]
MLKQKWFLKSSVALLLFVTPVTLTAQKLIASTDNTQTQSVSASQTPQVGQLEVVSELNITPGNVTASRDGRIFASVHGMRRGSAQLIEIQPGSNNWQPFPNAEWNGKPGSSNNVLNSAHGVAIDSQDRLWVIDHGNWMPNGAEPTRPKLVAFDINTREMVYRYDFPESATGTIMQDLAVDGERGFVYIADCGSNPAIVVVDTNNNTSRRFENHPSLQAENIDAIVEGQQLLFPNSEGKMQPARVPVNPITLSADGETLYFGAMNGETWYSASAGLLREGESDRTIGAAIKEVGQKPVSDGVSTDAQGNHFITNLKDNAIDKLSADGKLTRLVQDDRLLWADNVRFGNDSWLYIAVNQLHRNPIFTGKPDAGKPPYYIMRVWTGTQGQPGR